MADGDIRTSWKTEKEELPHGFYRPRAVQLPRGFYRPRAVQLPYERKPKRGERGQLVPPDFTKAVGS